MTFCFFCGNSCPSSDDCKLQQKCKKYFKMFKDFPGSFRVRNWNPILRLYYLIAMQSIKFQIQLLQVVIEYSLLITSCDYSQVISGLVQYLLCVYNTAVQAYNHMYATMFMRNALYVRVYKRAHLFIFQKAIQNRKQPNHVESIFIVEKVDFNAFLAPRQESILGSTSALHAVHNYPGGF